MKTKPRILMSYKHGFIVLVSLLLTSCASPQHKMTDAALKGDTAKLDEFFSPGAADINAAAEVDDAQGLCPGESHLTPLQAASCAGHAPIVKKLIENKADPNLATNTGQTPLGLATVKGKEEVVTVLIKGGAKIDAADVAGNTALMLAAKQGGKPIATFLLKNGASVKTRNQAGETALMLASDVAIAKMLIELGADPQMKNNKGESALHIAARNQNTAMAKYFLERGVKSDLTSRNGDTALSLARGQGNTSMISLLEETLSKQLEKELAEGERAAKEEKYDQSLALYSSTLSKARVLGGSIEQDILLKIIKNVNAQAEPPAMPEQAREHLVRSSYILNHGQDVGEAEKEMLEVQRLAPWWLEGYYNLGVLQAGQSKYDQAIRNLTLFVAAAPSSPKAQAAQDKIYEIKIASEQAQKIKGLNGQWRDVSGILYNVAINGNALNISAGTGLVYTLKHKDGVIEGSVAGGPQGGPHGCTIPGQIHPVNGKLDLNTPSISLEHLWSAYDTHFHCVNMAGVTSTCCLLCDEVCDSVSILSTGNATVQISPSR